MKSSAVPLPKYVRAVKAAQDLPDVLYESSQRILELKFVEMAIWRYAEITTGYLLHTYNNYANVGPSLVCSRPPRQFFGS